MLHHKEHRPAEGQGLPLTFLRDRVEDVRMKKTTIAMIAMTLLTAKTSSLVPNLLMLLRLHKLRCMCRYQLGHPK
jgi:hypothetical protein